MRDRAEIEHLQTELSNHAESLDWLGDNFKYGLYCGKLMALEWVLGEVATGAICVNEDYEDFLREQKIEMEDLRESLTSGRQKPKAAGDDGRQTTGSKSVIRLDHSRLLKIENDNSIVEQIALADVITVRTHSNEREQCLFKRPTQETKARGLPYNIHTLQFSVQNVKDLRHLTDVINRMKQGE